MNNVHPIFEQILKPFCPDDGIEGGGMKSINVFNAAKKTFENYGDEEYATSKAYNFLRRCGAKYADGPDKDIPKSTIEQVVYAMLDADSEQVFWANIS